MTAPFSSRETAQRFAEGSDVITYEFEHIDAGVVAWLEERKPVIPGSEILSIAQHRREEKQQLARRGFPLVAHALASSQAELWEAVRDIGYPVVAKTATAGYDGKGQTVLSQEEDTRRMARHLGESPQELVIEKFESLLCEVSVIAIRSQKGEVATFPVAENEHRENILHLTMVPARISETIRRQAAELAREIIESFALTGVLCVEMFITREERILVNELAPRPHNSGHFSLDACDVSQFEALVRSICRLPLPVPRLFSPCAMINILGKHMDKLDVDRLMKIPGAKLHLYGKRRIERRRKMGHITVLAPTSHDVERQVAVVEALLGEDRAPG